MRAKWALIVAALAVAPAAALEAPTGGHLSTAEPVGLFGTTTAGLTGIALWLAPPDGQVAGTPSFTITADALGVDIYEYETQVRIDHAAGHLYTAEPLRQDHRTLHFDDVETTWLGGGGESLMRIVPASGVQTSVRLHDAKTLYPDAATAADASAPRTVRLGGDPAIAPFLTMPSGVPLLAGQGAELRLAGPADLLLHDLAVAISHADGSSALDGGVHEARYGGDTGLVVRSWTDVILHVPAGGDIRVQWPHGAAFAARSFDLSTAHGAEMRAASGLIQWQEGARVLDGEDVRINGQVEATIAAAAGRDGTTWRFTAPTAAATPAEAVATLPAEPDLPTWAWTTLAAAMLTAAGTTTLLLRRRRAHRTGTAVSPGGVPGTIEGSPAAATPARNRERGLALFHAGRHAEAVRPLQRAAATPEGATDGEILYCLGVALLRTGEYTDGFARLRGAVRMDAGYLQLLVTRPETESIRFDRRFVTFMRKEARHFQDGLQMGYC